MRRGGRRLIGGRGHGLDGEHEVEVERVVVAVRLARVPAGARVMGHVVGDKGCAHAEHDVAVEIRVTGAEHMGDERAVAGCLDAEVHVPRPPWMAAARDEHAANRAVGGHRVGDGQHRAEA